MQQINKNFFKERVGGENRWKWGVCDRERQRERRREGRREHVYSPFRSLVAQMGKNLPAVQETRVQSLGWEDPLEKGMATHSSIFAWEIPWTEEPGGLQYMGSRRVGHD